MSGTGSLRSTSSGNESYCKCGETSLVSGRCGSKYGLCESGKCSLSMDIVALPQNIVEVDAKKDMENVKTLVEERCLISK